MEQSDFRKIAEQLRRPEGQNGIAIAERMLVNNGEMIKKCIDLLGIKDQERILEIGHGGGFHVPYLLEKAMHIVYTGVDISDTMVALAREQNANAVADGIVSFLRVDVNDGSAVFPFLDDSFDGIFTVNTLYFWDNAVAQAREIHRVLKPGGTFALCFATKEFMSALPFTQFGFNIYSVEKAKALLEAAGFSAFSFVTEQENITTSANESVEREFIVVLSKK